MIIEQAIKNRIISDTTLVGSNVHYSKATQDVIAPYIVLTKISKVPYYTYDGSAGMVDSRYQFSVFAATYALCEQIMEELRVAFSGYTGTMGGVGGVYVNACFIELESDLSFNDDTKLYGLGVDYRILHAG